MTDRPTRPKVRRWADAANVVPADEANAYMDALEAENQRVETARGHLSKRCIRLQEEVSEAEGMFEMASACYDESQQYVAELEAKVRAFADARDKALADAIEAAKAANHFQEVAQRLKHQLIVDYAEDDDE